VPVPAKRQSVSKAVAEKAFLSTANAGNEVEIGRRMPEQMAISTRGGAAEAF
jgi:hypothetical protein